MKDFSLPKIGNFELTQQEKTIVGKEETSKINTVKNETTFILEMKLSFEVVARGHEQDILCASFVYYLSYVIACAAATLERNQSFLFIQKSSKTRRSKITRNCNPFHQSKKFMHNKCFLQKPRNVFLKH